MADNAAVTAALGDLTTAVNALAGRIPAPPAPGGLTAAEADGVVSQIQAVTAQVNSLAPAPTP